MTRSTEDPLGDDTKLSYWLKGIGYLLIVPVGLMLLVALLNYAPRL